MKVLVVVDMQNDFVSGPLGTQEAMQIVERVAAKIADYDGMLVSTYDTHDDGYPNTQEGRLLPVQHCIANTDGWQLVDPVREAIHRWRGKYKEFYKDTFDSPALAGWLVSVSHTTPIEEIEIVGLCTDICVVANAMLIKAYMPEVPVFVDAACCAGTSPQAHEAALQTMQSCQIIIRNGG